MPDPNRATILVPRLFTVRAANAFVPRLNELFLEVRGALAKAQELARQLADKGFPVGDDVETLMVDPGADASIQELQREIGKIVKGLRVALNEVAEMGAEVKAVDGLVDFRSRKAGEVVYLCWRFGENEITFWHDLSSGFAGRVPIDDAQGFEGDLLQ